MENYYIDEAACVRESPSKTSVGYPCKNDIHFSNCFKSHPPTFSRYPQPLTIRASTNEGSQLLKKGSKCTAQSILIMLKMWSEIEQSGGERDKKQRGRHKSAGGE